MEVPQNTRFTKTHEWVREEEGDVLVGITDFAQQQLSDITFVELPNVGDEVKQEDEVAVVESVKAASDIYAPLSGTVTRINEALDDKPELINEDPLGNGWLFALQPGRPDELKQMMTPEAYEKELPDVQSS